jgi:hypothetical protein
MAYTQITSAVWPDDLNPHGQRVHQEVRSRISCPFLGRRRVADIEERRSWSTFSESGGCSMEERHSFGFVKSWLFVITST